jgi:hypothetical protein
MQKQITKLAAFNDGSLVAFDRNGDPYVSVEKQAASFGSSSLDGGFKQRGLLYFKDADRAQDIIDSLGGVNVDANTFMNLYSPAMAELGGRLFVYDEHVVSAVEPKGQWQPLQGYITGTRELYDITVDGVSCWKRSVCAPHEVDATGATSFVPNIISREMRDSEPVRKPLTAAEQKALDKANKAAGVPQGGVKRV